MPPIKRFRFYFILLSAPIFLPILINQYDYKYTVVIFLFSFLGWLLAGKKNIHLDNNVRIIRIITYLYMAIIILKMIVYNDYSYTLFNLLLPFILSAVFIEYSQSISDSKSQEFIQKCFNAVYVIFILQFVLSLIESLFNFYFVEAYNILNKNFLEESNTYINRFIIPVPLFLNPFNYLHFGLSGLLGQHNYWGMQLPVYNLIFLYAYLRNKERKYFIILMFVLVAQVLNTTRTSLVLIVLSDLLMFFYLYVKTSKRSRLLIYIVTILVIIIFSDKIIALLQAIVTKSDTLTIRLNIYQYAWYYLKVHYQELLIGYDYRAIGNLVIGFLRSAKFTTILRGFENGFFDLVFIYGIAGFTLFLALVYTIVTIFWKNRHGILLSIVFILYVIFINMTLTHIFPSFIFPFIILLIVIISRDTVMNRNGIDKTIEGV